MKKTQRVLMIVVILASLVQSVAAFAMDSCPVWKEVPGSAEGVYADYDITFPVWLAPNWAAVLKGNRIPYKEWIYHEIVSVDPVKSTATARVFGWTSGEDIEFSTGKYDKADFFQGVNLDDVVFWSDPTVCQELLYPKDAPPDKRHYKMKLGEKFQPKTNNAQPAINYLLLLKSKSPPQPSPVIHQCSVSVERTATHGNLGDYRIVKSLQKFDPAAPANAVPYVTHQTDPDYADVPWTGWYSVQRVGDTAIVLIKDWPITWSIRLSTKLVAGGVDYWEDPNEWLFMGCESNYFDYGAGHYVIPLL